MSVPGPGEALLSLCIGTGLYAIPVGALVWVIILLKRIEARLKALEEGMQTASDR